ncbi:MAG: hypothetical protein Kow0031_34340 [Anaerolineae bacterium]
MARFYQFEAEARQAILHNALVAYQRQTPNWQQQPALRRTVIAGALTGIPAVVILSLMGLATVVVVVLFRATPQAAALAGGVMLLGGIALGGWLWLALADEHRWQRALAARLEPQARFAPGTLRDRGLQQRLYRVLHLWGLVQQITAQLPPGAVKVQIQASCSQTTGWLASAYALAVQADELQWNTALAQRQSAGRALPAAQEVRRQLAETNKRLDHTIAGLQALHNELLLMAGSGKQSQQMARLQAEIGSEVARLQDLTAAMREVYNCEL